MPNKANRKQRALNRPRTFEQYDQEIQRLSVEQSLALEKAYYSNDPIQIVKAQNFLNKDNRGKKQPDIKSWLYMPEEYNYTGSGYKEALKGVTFDNLKSISKLFIIRLIHDTRIDQVKNYLQFSSDDQKEGFTIVKKRGVFDNDNIETNRNDKKKIVEIVKFLEEGGENSKWDNYDDFQEFVSKILRDSLTYDQCAFETVRARNGELKKYVAVDASMIRHLDSQDPRYRDQFKGMEWNGFLPKYCMSWQSQILHNPVTGNPIIYYPWELGYGVRNKVTDNRSNGYGVGELEIGIELVTWILWSFQYNANFFKNGSQPKGFINIKGEGGGDNTVINEFRNNWRQMMSGVGNCLSGSTFIITDEGRKELKDFFLNDESDKETLIWTGKKFEKGLVYKSGKKNVQKITLNNGMNIECSNEHRFKTVDDLGNIIWKRQSELKEGDFLMINKTSIPNNEIIYYKGKEVESDLFEVIGWLTGDGWLGENEPKKKRGGLCYHQDFEIFIQQYHSMILSKYCINNLPNEIIKDEKNIQSALNRYGFKSASKFILRTDIVDADFFEFLYSLGFTSSNKGKTIPDFLFSCNPKYRRAFLRGFFSADCHVAGGRYIQMSITNPKLRQLTKELLLLEGIRCGNHEGKKKTTSLNKNKSIEGYLLLVKDNDIFFEKIGLLQIYKGFKENDYKYYSVKDSLPVSLCKKEISSIKEDMKLRWKDLKQRLCNQKVTDDISAVLTNKEVFSYNRFKNLYDTISKYFYKYEINQEILDFHFEKIIKIEDLNKEEEMYDVQIFDNENQFIANGILTHNSHKIPVFEGIDLEWIDLQMKNRDMEFNQWVEFLLVVFCSLYRIDPSELGFNFKQQTQMFGQQGQKERLDHSQKKGLKPLLVFLQKLINKYIVSELDENYEFKFTGVDIEDEESQVKLDDEKLKAGLVSFESMFEKYMGRKYDPKKDTILNPAFNQSQQMKQYGGQDMNNMVDEQTGEGDQGVQNPFEQFNKSQESDPIVKESLNYINSILK